jgi:hypothetical protein
MADYYPVDKIEVYVQYTELVPADLLSIVKLIEDSKELGLQEIRDQYGLRIKSHDSQLAISQIHTGNSITLVFDCAPIAQYIATSGIVLAAGAALILYALSKGTPKEKPKPYSGNDRYYASDSQAEYRFPEYNNENESKTNEPPIDQLKDSLISKIERADDLEDIRQTFLGESMLQVGNERYRAASRERKSPLEIKRANVERDKSRIQRSAKIIQMNVGDYRIK